MSPVREREGLIARIRQIRRTAEGPATPPRKAAPRDDAGPLQALEARVEHVEQLVEALQDSVHRDSQRYGERITELEAQIQPSALHVALNKDARDRGL